MTIAVSVSGALVINNNSNDKGRKCAVYFADDDADSINGPSSG